jgi:hypothetical protein
MMRREATAIDETIAGQLVLLREIPIRRADFRPAAGAARCLRNDKARA